MFLMVTFPFSWTFSAPVKLPPSLVVAATYISSAGLYCSGIVYGQSVDAQDPASVVMPLATTWTIPDLTVMYQPPEMYRSFRDTECC